MPTAKSQSLSLALHAATVLLLLALTSQSLRTPAPAQPPIRYVPLIAPKLIFELKDHRGGGSNASQAPARRGVPPVRSHKTFIPPDLTPEPRLAVTPVVDFDTPQIHIAGLQIGDPLSKYANGMLGKYGRNGIGDIPGNDGIGAGPPGPGVSAGFDAPIRPPELIYRVDPEFSDDARKAKFQGFVVLMIEIGTDGRPHHIRVVESPGMGLEEKAMEAVAKWRFRPAYRGSTAIPSTARVEVYFHLF